MTTAPAATDSGLFPPDDEPRFFGKYHGFVTDNEDQKHLGRIRARVPEVLGTVKTGWALPCVPYAGDGVGSFLIPPKKAGVWIEFEGGRLASPIWTGCWWGKAQLPKNNQGTEPGPPLKVIRTAKGLMLTFDDDKSTIHLSDQNGSNMVEINAADGKITVKATQKVVVDAPLVDLVQEGVTHPIPFGDELLNYLNQLVTAYNAHLHTGEMCLGTFPVSPVPPLPSFSFPPATSSLLSMKAKTG